MATRIDGDLTVDGHFSAGTQTVADASVRNASIASDAAIERTKLDQDDLKPYAVNLTDLRVWNDFAVNLPNAAASDDLGLIDGAFGTAAPKIQAGDLKAAGATTRRARFLVRLPAEYVDGETVVIRVRGGMVTTVADVSCTVDLEVHEIDGDGGIGADICATAATTINSLDDANKDFTITATDLVAGDLLDVRLSIACNDAATVTAVIPQVGKITLLCDVKG